MKLTTIPSAIKPYRAPSVVSLSKIAGVITGTIKLLLLIGLSLAPSFIFAEEKGDGSKTANMNLNSLTKKEYGEFVKETVKEAKKDAQASGEMAKKVIIGMAGLENRPKAHGVFEVDVNFNINAMCLLVANANKIKREKGFIDEFKREMKGVRPQLKTEDERIYFDVFTSLLLSDQEKL